MVTIFPLLLTIFDMIKIVCGLFLAATVVLTESVSNGSESVLKDAKSVSDATEPVLKNAEPVLKDAEPVSDSIQPVLKDDEQMLDFWEPKVKAAEKSVDTTEPASNDTAPVSNDTAPILNDPQPASNGTEPASNGTEPASNGTEPASNVTEPTSSGTEPASNGTEPASNGTEPVLTNTESASNATAPQAESTTENVSGAKTTEPKSNKTENLDTVSMIERDGYPVEVHSNIQTTDRYRLTVHRIPHNKSNAAEKNKPVAFLMHGLFSSSTDWVNMGPEHSLAYQLSDAGYDVWMGNARGTKWSRQHKILDATYDSRYWDFSWHEIGVRDLPTMIDYVLGVTGQDELFYIGFSQGATVFYVMCSQIPRYNWKIRHMIALAPVAYTAHVSNPFLTLVSEFSNNTEWIAKSLGSHEFRPDSKLTKMMGARSCDDDSPDETQCDSVYFLFGGWDSAQLNKSTIPVILSNAPAGASTRQILHYAQGITSGEFRQYDYGRAWNLLNYWSRLPPVYDISRITAPMSIYYADADKLATLADIDHFANELPSMPNITKVNSASFNHLDFLYAMNAKTLLYDGVVKLMNEL